MIDHMGITVSDIARSRKFYSKALGALEYSICMEGPDFVSFGVKSGHGKSTDPGGEFWLSEDAPITPCVHIAFSAATRADVVAFYEAGLAAGGTANGAPGLRPHYHPNYYAAFVLDPDGYNIEAVCHTG
jgi:catechol 2,3-dioxygenase-like lactoylglutathione lyase family enzyme